MPITLRIGKSGLSPGILTEAKLQLKAHKTIKVKLLRQVLDSYKKKALIEAIAKETESRVLHQRGNIIILTKKGL